MKSVEILHLLKWSISSFMFWHALSFCSEKLFFPQALGDHCPHGPISFAHSLSWQFSTLLMASNRPMCTTFTDKLQETISQLNGNITALDTTINDLRDNITIQESIKNQPDAALDGCLSSTNTLVSDIATLRQSQDDIQKSQREKVNEETIWWQIFDLIWMGGNREIPHELNLTSTSYFYFR